MLTIIEQLINFFAQNPLISLLTGGYLLITFGDSKERNLYFKRTWQILISPIKIDEYMDAPKSFESFERWLEKLLLITYVKSALDNLSKNVSDAFKLTWKKITGWLFLDIMLVTFLIADLITIREIASLLGFPINFGTLPFLSFLERFDYGFAITAGTFFSIVASAFVLFEITSKSESQFTDFSSPFYDYLRNTIKFSVIFTLISSLLVIFFFGLRAYVVAVTIPDDTANSINALAQFGGNVLVRINTFVITLVISTESINGLQSIFILLVLISIVILALIYLVAGTITTILRVAIDIIYRTFLWLIWTLSFWIAKPVDKLLWPIKLLWEKISGKKPPEGPDEETEEETPKAE